MKNYAIVFGGISYEHEISIISAITLKDVIKKDKIFIFCDKKRDFYLISKEKMKAKYFSSGEYKKRYMEKMVKMDYCRLCLNFMISIT